MKPPARKFLAFLIVSGVLLLITRLWLWPPVATISTSRNSAIRLFGSSVKLLPKLAAAAAEWRQIEQRLTPKQNRAGVPRILHYVFKNELAFEAYKPLIRSCLDQNPGWQVFLWRDSDSEKLIQQYYKHFANKYRSYGDRLEKSDSIRYMILHKFGGIYLDMDVQCLRPFDQLLQPLSTGVSLTGGISAFLGEERREQTRILYGYSFCTMNSLMGSEPGHPFFQLAIDRMRSMPNMNHARLSTGPDFLTNAYYSWVNSSKSESHPVHVFPARLVSPLMDTSLVNWEQQCQPYFRANRQRTGNQEANEDVWKALGCAELVAKGWQFDDTDNGTVAVHSFLHLGYGSQSGLKTFDVLKEFPRIKLHSAS